MHLFVDNKSGQPIYEQIYSQIRNCILSGELAEDEALPSIRALTKDLHISVITTKRAYDELEREGLLYTVAGKGCFVARQNGALARENMLREIEDHMERIAELAAICSLSVEEIMEMYRIMVQSNEEEKS